MILGVNPNKLCPGYLKGEALSERISDRNKSVKTQGGNTSSQAHVTITAAEEIYSCKNTDKLQSFIPF